LDRLVVLALSVMLSGCAARQAIPIAAGADLVTTEMALTHSGAVELNPLPTMQRSSGRFAWKAVGALVVIWACERLERLGFHRGAKWLKWGTVALWGAAATWNAALMK
jgi:hypothetical protein